MEFREKYAKIEWERRFLLARFPVPENVTRVRKIIDRYIIGTTVRLREEIERGGGPASSSHKSSLEPPAEGSKASSPPCIFQRRSLRSSRLCHRGC